MARNKYDIDEVLTSENTFNFKHLMRVGGYIKPYRKRMFITLIFLVVSTVLNLTTPVFLKMVLDDFIPERMVWHIVGIAAVMLVILFITALIMRFRMVAMSMVGQGIIRDMRKDVFDNMQRLPFAYYDNRPHGKILVRVVNYINSLSDLLSNGLINLITESFSLIVIVMFMLWLDWRLTLVTFIGLPFLMLAIFLIKTAARKAWQLHAAKQSNLNAYLHESIAGIRITQVYTREDKNDQLLDTVAKSTSKSWLDACKFMFLMTPSVENIQMWSTSLLYLFAVTYFMGTDGVTLGLFVAFTGYVARFWMPITQITNVYNNLVVNMAYLERIFETIDEPVNVKDKDNAGVMPEIIGRVKFDNVTFSYDAGRPVLKNVSFECNPGDTIALVGPTGAGKTTVVNLITRFYDIDSGEVSIDGHDVSAVQLATLRAQMGIMLQDTFIFSGTIYDNIRYSKLDATNDEIIAVAKVVKAHDFIMDMEKGYDTEVNERGSQLSAGQKQLISFARALLADPKILILDEATSSIDTKTELALQEGLARLLEGRTSFIIAHRLSTIKNATCIMYIDDGRIVEAGNHDELIAHKGEYYKLYKAQYAFLGM